MNTHSPTYSLIRNYLQSVILLTGMLFLLGIIGWLLAGPAGITWTLLAGIAVMLSAPRLTPQFILQFHHARALHPEDAPGLYEIIAWLAERAGLKITPTLYYFPAKVINSFTTGSYENTAIAVSEGMLNQLSPREITGVLAHEISHIQNKDLLVMLVADVIRHLTSIMAVAGYLLFWIYIPLYLLADATAPWSLLMILIFAPSLSILMQLALSRAHEFSADAAAVSLTNDPQGLASALEKIEYSQSGWIERAFAPTRRMYNPSLFRTHPLMSDRINRLKQITAQTPASPHPFTDDEDFGQIKLADSSRTVRRRFYPL